jgi:WD40 repeat protein
MFPLRTKKPHKSIAAQAARTASRLRLAALALAAFCTFIPLLQAQEHVRLVPQVGNSGIWAVAFSPNGRTIFIGSADGIPLLWDINTEKLLRSFEPTDKAVHSVAFSPDGRLMLIGTMDDAPLLYDVATGKLIRRFDGHTGPVYAVVFSSDGRFVLTGSDDNTAGLWDAATGKMIHSFVGHEQSVMSVAYSPDGRFVLTGSIDKTARLWDVATGAPVRAFKGHTDVVKSVAFSPDGHFVLTGSDDGTARLWDATTGNLIRTLKEPTDRADKTLHWINAVAFSPDGRSLFTGSVYGAALLWDAATGMIIRSFTGHTGHVGAAVFSPDGHSVLTSGGDRTARLWDMTTGQQVRSFEGHTGLVASIAFSPDSRLVLTGSGDNTARLWNAATGKLIRSFVGHNSPVGTVAFSPDTRSVLTGGYDNTARLWDAATGKQLRSFDVPMVSFRPASFSPDGHFVLTGGWDNVARLWDTATGQQIRSFDGKAPHSGLAAFSPDGRSVATSSLNPTAWLWNASTGKQILPFEGNGGALMSMAFSPDGRFLLAGCGDGKARLWDVGTGRLIRSFEGHSSQVNSANFSPDGRLIVTTSADTTVRIWDAATGKQLAVLLSFDHNGWAVTDAEGRYDSNDPDNTPGLAWVTDSNRIIDLDQLKDNYYTPNLLARILKGERLPGVKGLDEVPAPPEVVIAAAYQPGTRTVALDLKDQGGGIGRIVVNVNGRQAALLDHSAAQAGHVTVDLASATLLPGENAVTAYAFDAGNQIRSHPASASFFVAANAKGLTPTLGSESGVGTKPKFYAIVIGASTYGNPEMNLQYPAHDAESIMTGLQVGAGRLFGQENLHLRLLTTDAKDEASQPTKANIDAAFADVLRHAAPSDVLLVYLSGHGVSPAGEKDSYYYLTADARSLNLDNNPELRNLSTVSSAELRQWLGAKNMPLKEVLILDTCAAGAANSELLKLVEKRDVPPDQRRAVEFLKDSTGTHILMGAAADKVSYEANKYGQGLLTYALLEGMRGRSLDNGDSGSLDVSRWFEDASKEVPDLARSIGGIQKPVIAAPKGTGFPVALYKHDDLKDVPLAAVRQQLLRLICQDDHYLDSLRLGAAVRERLRAASYTQNDIQARGSATDSTPVLYLDQIADLPGALQPQIHYSVQGQTATLHLLLVREEQLVKEKDLTASAADPAALADQTAAALLAMAASVPLAPP